jgi:hypothetical protein
MRSCLTGLDRFRNALPRPNDPVTLDASVVRVGSVTSVPLSSSRRQTGHELTDRFRNESLAHGVNRAPVQMKS